MNCQNPVVIIRLSGKVPEFFPWYTNSMIYELFSYLRVTVVVLRAVTDKKFVYVYFFNEYSTTAACTGRYWKIFRMIVMFCSHFCLFVYIIKKMRSERYILKSGGGYSLTYDIYVWFGLYMYEFLYNRKGDSHFLTVKLVCKILVCNRLTNTLHVKSLFAHVNF